MSNAVEKAHKFLQEEQAFRLGSLLTESSHPKTLQLSQSARKNLPDAIRILQSVDDEIPPVVRKTLQSPVFRELCEAFYYTFQHQKRIFFTGCGATGRLAILLDAAWRKFWRNLNTESPALAQKLPNLEDYVASVMAGVTISTIRGDLEARQVARLMPNLAASQRRALVGLSISDDADEPFRALAQTVARAIGDPLEVPEKLMAATLKSA